MLRDSSSPHSTEKRPPGHSISVTAHPSTARPTSPTPASAPSGNPARLPTEPLLLFPTHPLPSPTHSAQIARLTFGSSAGVLDLKFSMVPLCLNDRAHTPNTGWQLEFSVTPKICQSSNPRTLECDFIWRWRASLVVLVIKNPPAHAGNHKRYRFNPWVRKIP